jgi:hypothetical protein
LDYRLVAIRLVSAIVVGRASVLPIANIVDVGSDLFAQDWLSVFKLVFAISFF